MKKRVMWMLMLCGMASIGIVPVSEADFLSDLLANPPQAPYVDRQGEAARPGEQASPPTEWRGVSRRPASKPHRPDHTPGRSVAQSKRSRSISPCICGNNAK